MNPLSISGLTVVLVGAVAAFLELRELANGLILVGGLLLLADVIWRRSTKRPGGVGNRGGTGQ